MKIFRYLGAFQKNVLNIIDTVIEGNTLFTHPENVLLSILTEGDSTINKFAVKKISDARKHKINNIRVFTVPEFMSINVNFKSFFGLK